MKIDDLPLMLEAWYQVLKNYETDEIGANLIVYVESGVAFPPSVGQLLPKKSSGVVPNAAETRLLLEANSNRQNVATEEEREKALAEIRKTLGIERRSSNV